MWTYAAFTHGLISEWTYLMRTISDIGHLLEPLEKTIHSKFIPALTGQGAPNNLDI